MGSLDNEELKTIFSKNILYWLAQRGKTQADLYKKMEVSSATASDWCNGKKLPRTDKLVDIASWLMIELSDLLETKDYSETPSTENQIAFRLKDDERFRSIITLIYNASDKELDKIEDYINLVVGNN